MKKITSLLAISTVFFLALSFFLATGCQRDNSDPNPNPGTNEPPVNDNEMVVAGVRGTVVNANNQPVAGATVTSGTNTTTTDSHGSFTFSNINLSKANGYVKVSKAGYFTGSRTFISKAGRVHTVRIKLLPKTNTGSFTASSGGTINVTGGGKLVMPANAITDAGGTAYTGTVNVAMTWIDPTSVDLPNIIPGDLRGITTGGQERGLQTYGMLGVELTGSGGQSLKVATGKTAELTFPIPASLQGSAPATIDLWNFDEATGRWKQEGTATKNGSNYIANVSHFSFWNCDAQFPIVEVCMTVVSTGNNMPMNNVLVRIKRPNGNAGYGRTDSLGNLCGKVPKDEALTLEVMGHCGNVVHSQNIGPFSSDASLGNIAITIPPNSLTITGTLTNCSNANVTNGSVIVYTNIANYPSSYSVPVTNGAFSITLIRCDNSPVSYTVHGIDYATMQEGFPLNGSTSATSVNVGTLLACGTSATQFIQFLVDGALIAYAEPPNSLFVIDSSFAGNNNVTIYADAQNQIMDFSFFKFAGNGSTGTFPLSEVFVGGEIGVGQLTTILGANPTVNITTFGPLGTGYIEGNFSIVMASGGPNPPKNVVCTFRVKRN